MIDIKESLIFAAILAACVCLLVGVASVSAKWSKQSEKIAVAFVEAYK